MMNTTRRPARARQRRGGLAGIALLALAGCLEPLVDDTVDRDDGIVAPGATVPALFDDPLIAAQVAKADGVAGRIDAQRGFADGGVVDVWDLGPAPVLAPPVYVVGQRMPDGTFTRIAHPGIIDVVPGDFGYSPFWSMFTVEVTPAYAGEQLTSVAAIYAAVDQGLVLAPVRTGAAVNCPVFGADVALIRPSGAAWPSTTTFFYKGRSVPYYDFGMMPLDDAGGVPLGRRVELRREGAEPLSEPVRGVDMTGDGDTADSNDVFEWAPGLGLDNPRLRTVRVAVASATASIDTSGDDAVADLTALTMLFAPGPTALVIAVDATDDIRHWVKVPAEAVQ